MHSRRAFLCGTSVALAARPTNAFVQQSTLSIRLAEGTRWATGCFSRASGRPGPIVFIMGGVHGDEPAGAVAAEQIRNWELRSGTTVVVPRCNEPALRAGTRLSPGASHPDLARCFPRSTDDQPRETMASILWRIIVRLEPDWILDLHEGWGVHRRNPKTLGSTVLHGPGEDNRRMAEQMMRAANDTIADARNHLQALEHFIPGSSVYAANRFLAIPCIVQETTRIGRTVSSRVRLHEVMARALLSGLGMLEEE